MMVSISVSYGNGALFLMGNHVMVTPTQQLWKAIIFISTYNFSKGKKKLITVSGGTSKLFVEGLGKSPKNAGYY